MAQRSAAERLAALGDLGPNAGLVEEMYRLFVEDPGSVAEGWRDFFDGYAPRGVDAPQRAPFALHGEQPQPLRGAQARVAENMEASLAIPTATSARSMPAKLLEVNRQILNNHLARTRGGKVSFTHLIAYAVLRAIESVPAVNASYGVLDGTPSVVRHEHVNLGLAVDLQKADGSRSLVVPNVKGADALGFAAFHAAYEDVIRRARSGRLTVDDLAATTVTITNPGMIGTQHSVPRLMPGQGLIVGVGAIDHPVEYEGADPGTLARLGVGKIVTLTSTYDHRIVQGAQSGELLGRVHDLLLGADGFYDEAFRSLGVPYEPARWSRDRGASDDGSASADKALAVAGLVNMYRVRGHLIANLDPLALREPKTHRELDPAHWGLTIWDLDRGFPTAGLAGRSQLPLREILRVLRDAYSRSVGIEYMHIQEPDQKAWIQENVEGARHSTSPADQLRLLHGLNAAEAFERFLHTKYLGQKRFSLEGAETLIPMLGVLLDAAADAGIDEVVMGMAHRGRLNVLANIVGKSYGQIFREFEGSLDPNVPQGSGDVKYHLGAVGAHVAPSGNSIAITLAANPSHLEAVDPVVEGMARAKQDRSDDARGDLVLPVLVHGDAAFAGQGIVAETLNLSALPGYDVGGTVHIVVNNQVGFTTPPGFARSTVYATDIAKAVQAPIFHVNGDDPEAAARVMGLAFAFRQEFRKDVVVDLVCYRRYGHNEADEPAFTQPRMYDVIGKRRSVRKLYTETLVNRGDLTIEDAEAAFDDYRLRLQRAFDETRDDAPPPPAWSEPGAGAMPPPGRSPARTADPRRSQGTAVARDVLSSVVDALAVLPDGFTVHPKLARVLGERRAAFDSDSIDWALAETLAFGSLLLEGTAVRLSGQDTRRGTFSQRHATLVDNITENEYTPLAHLDPAQPPFMVYDSVLSEAAALGFEYGYSVSDAATLVCWEAQFGDFANVAQTIIDQFIAAAEDKWGQRSSLVLLLPHGFEGQGPEHSSARIERFLALCAQDNLRVVYPTTAAQCFHALRRQVVQPERKPLVLLAPKRYLRVPSTRSPVTAFTDGRFEPVLDDPRPPAPDTVTRVAVCSGKLAWELIERRDSLGAPVAVARVEQLYPFPETELGSLLGRYPSAREVVWVQEEPENMGARSAVLPRLRAIAAGLLPVRSLARPSSPSPATGSHTVHEREQESLLAAALG